MLKNKKVLFTILIMVLMLIFALSAKSYALTLPWLSISSNNYSKGDKVNSNLDIVEVEAGKTLKLYAIIVYGNEMIVPGNPDSVGIFVDETNLSGVTWTSNNTNIASVDSNGTVTGVAEGTAVITAQHNGESATYNISVTKSNEEPLPDVTTINTIDITVPSIKAGDKKLSEKDINVIGNGNIKITPDNIFWSIYNEDKKEYEDDWNDDPIKANTKYYIDIAIATNDFGNFIYVEGTNESNNSNNSKNFVFGENMIIKVNNKIIDKTNSDFFEDFGNLIGVKYYIDTAESTEVNYGVIEGKDSTYVTGKDKTLTIKIDAPFNKFLKVFLDDKEVDSKNYEAKEGSTVITFKEAYLKTLSKGKHNLKIAFEDGYAFSDLTISDKSDNNSDYNKNNDNTEDGTKAPGTIPYTGGTLVMILSAILLIIIGTTAYKKVKDLRGI